MCLIAIADIVASFTGAVVYEADVKYLFTIATGSLSIPGSLRTEFRDMFIFKWLDVYSVGANGSRRDGVQKQCSPAQTMHKSSF
jgi:hypothetical protein